MPRKLLLFADDDAFGRLRAAGMPDRLLIDRKTGGDVQTEQDFIERLDPASLIPWDTGGDLRVDRDGVEERERAFADLLEQTVCHVVVLENPPSAAGRGEQTVVLSDRAQLERLVRWYRVFREEAGRRVDYRQTDFRHVLILICAEDLPNEQLPLLNELLGGGERPSVIHTCYVMLRRLNWARSSICHARYVWPLSVARLLIYLLADPGAAAARTEDESVILAWRAIELVPTIPAALVEGQVRNRLHRLRRELLDFSAANGPDWDAKAFRPEPHVPLQTVDAPSLPDPARWYDFSPQRVLADVIDPRRWSDRLRGVGEGFAAAMSHQFLTKAPEPAEQVARVWTSVHADPSSVSRALAQPELLEGPENADELRRLIAGFDRLRDAMRQRGAAIDDAGNCAEVMVETQRGFVGPGRRIFVGCTVAGCVAYASIVVFQMLFGNLALSLAVASCGLAGAALAAFVPLILEHRAGIRAAEMFRNEVLHELDEQMIEQDGASQGLVADGHRSWVRSRAGSAARGLRRLLLRLNAMLQRELATFEGRSESHVGATPGELHASEASGDLPQRQQRDYLAETRVRSEIGDYTTDEAALDRRQQDFVREFMKLWNGLCTDKDPRHAGNMPAQAWIPALRDFRLRFEAAVRDEMYDQVLEHLGRCESEDWDDEIDRFLNERYDYYFSCPVTADVLDQQQRTRRLLLRSEVMNSYRSLGKQGLEVDSSPVIDALPMLGLLVDEAPIRLGLGDSCVEVVPP